VIVIIKFTSKLWSVSLVTKRLWAEVSMWRTAASSLKGWRVECRGRGIRIITPLVGAAACLEWRHDS